HYLLTLVVVMVFSGVLSAFINDTAVVALLMPVVISISRSSKISPSRLLMPLSFGSLMGGVCTLIGTSTNILVSGIAERYDLPAFGMFELTQAGIWFLGVGLLYMLIAGPFLLPKRKVEDDLSESYELGKYITEIRILPNSPMGYQPISKSALVKQYDIEILRVTKPSGLILEFAPDIIVEDGDVLTVRCIIEKVQKLAKEEGIELISDVSPDLRSEETKIFEALIPPFSSFVGKSLKQLRFKTIFEGSSVLAIRSRSEVIRDKISHAALRAGDIILVRAAPEQMQRFHKNDDLLVVSEIDDQKQDYKKIAIVIGIITAVIASAATGLLPIVLSASIGVVTLIGIRAISPEDAYKSIEWK